MQQSLRFYLDGLGFRMTKKWTPDGQVGWCWLELGETALMLKQFRTEGHDSWVPEGKVGVGVSINFQCRDDLALYKEFRSRSVDAATPMVGNSMWVTSAADPDGYKLYFGSPTDVPEETVCGGEAA